MPRAKTPKHIDKAVNKTMLAFMQKFGPTNGMRVIAAHSKRLDKTNREPQITEFEGSKVHWQYGHRPWAIGGETVGHYVVRFDPPQGRS